MRAVIKCSVFGAGDGKGLVITQGKQDLMVGWAYKANRGGRRTLVEPVVIDPNTFFKIFFREIMRPYDCKV